MKVVSVINYKGGVGKTTLTANLAAEMAYRDERVLVVDLDPQTNLTFSFLKVDEWEKNYEKSQTIKSWFDSITHKKIHRPHFENLVVTRYGIDIICSHLGLIDVDLDLAAGLAGGSPALQRWNYVSTYSYIKNELRHLSDVYDVVLFDCPPNFSTVTKNALVASDYYVVPAKMDYLSTLGINYLRNHVDELVKQYNAYVDEDEECSEEDHTNPEFLGVIATMVQLRNNALISTLQAQKYELERDGFPVFKNMMRENKTIFPLAVEDNKPVILHSYAQSTYSDIVRELENLTTEFMQRVGI